MFNMGPNCAFGEQLVFNMGPNCAFGEQLVFNVGPNVSFWEEQPFSLVNDWKCSYFFKLNDTDVGCC